MAVCFLVFTFLRVSSVVVILRSTKQSAIASMSFGLRMVLLGTVLKMPNHSYDRMYLSRRVPRDCHSTPKTGTHWDGFPTLFYRIQGEHRQRKSWLRKKLMGLVPSIYRSAFVLSPLSWKLIYTGASPEPVVPSPIEGTKFFSEFFNFSSWRLPMRLTWEAERW